jgi:hypothetical protein
LSQPRNKKRWIDPKKAVTFQLVHRSSRDINAGDGASEFVLKPQEELEPRNVRSRFGFRSEINFSVQNNNSEEESEEYDEIDDEEYDIIHFSGILLTTSTGLQKKRKRS